MASYIIAIKYLNFTKKQRQDIIMMVLKRPIFHRYGIKEPLSRFNIIITLLTCDLNYSLLLYRTIIELQHVTIIEILAKKTNLNKPYKGCSMFEHSVKKSYNPRIPAKLIELGCVPCNPFEIHDMNMDYLNKCYIVIIYGYDYMIDHHYDYLCYYFNTNINSDLKWLEIKYIEEHYRKRLQKEIDNCDDLNEWIMIVHRYNMILEDIFLNNEKTIAIFCTIYMCF